MAIIGKYKVRYHGESVIASVDSSGKLYLPDGTSVSLPQDKFEKIKADLENTADMAARSLTVPDADAHKQEGNYDSGQKAPVPEEPQGTIAEADAGTTEPVDARLSRKMNAEKRKEEKKAAKEAKLRDKRERREKRLAEKAAARSPQDHTASTGAGTSSKTPAIIAGLVVALVLVLFFAAAVILCVHYGIVTINVDPPANGLIIDDTIGIGH